MHSHLTSTQSLCRLTARWPAPADFSLRVLLLLPHHPCIILSMWSSRPAYGNGREKNLYMIPSLSRVYGAVTIITLLSIFSLLSFIEFNFISCLRYTLYYIWWNKIIWTCYVMPLTPGYCASRHHDNLRVSQRSCAVMARSS